MILKRFQRVYAQEPFILRVRALYLLFFNVVVFTFASLTFTFFSMRMKRLTVLVLYYSYSRRSLRFCCSGWDNIKKHWLSRCFRWR